ncbi:F0F1 ATP synthase subunit gamma [Parabacteroides bouchesdurhonensis]|uniref:F0F1 ATP synthase subunit gamma n=1 Tax=Parabacteroides bouchesdurhonensis TaxID=1936995 RepID=UPI000C81FB4F|nr:F0F1 ATP synthase subunit gamma [Parabacteroides bouchesdurhonensis]
MSSLKEIKIRIASVNSTKKITSAMKMVSSAKLHHSQGVIENLLPYEQQLRGILHNFLAANADLETPFAQPRPVRKVAIVAFSSNSGLCGTFNANVIKELAVRIQKYKEEQIDVLLYPIGKKVAEALKKEGYIIEKDFQQLIDKPDYKGAVNLATELMALFESEEVDKVELLYHHFKSSAIQQLLWRDWLPANLSQDGESETDADNYIIEPSPETMLNELLPKVLRLSIYAVLLDTVTSEHAARVLAMQTASDNANELLQELTLQYNKSRQQAITNELLDIIGGR